MNSEQKSLRVVLEETLAAWEKYSESKTMFGEFKIKNATRYNKASPTGIEWREYETQYMVDRDCFLAEAYQSLALIISQIRGDIQT